MDIFCWVREFHPCISSHSATLENTLEYISENFQESKSELCLYFLLALFVRDSSSLSYLQLNDHQKSLDKLHKQNWHQFCLTPDGTAC